MKTKTYYILDDSPYIVKYDNFKLYFSKEKNMNNFKENIDNFIICENAKLKSKYKINANLHDMLILACYKYYEKIGYKVKYNNIDLDENIIFVDHILYD